MDAFAYFKSISEYRSMRLGLERIEKLLELLGNPQDSYRTILVGGTAGKGSVTTMLSQILLEASYNVGRFTSPHLTDITERIWVNGKNITRREFQRIFENIYPNIEKVKKKLGERPTYFETLTAIVLKYFEEKNVDFAVLEVGLGGRLDATNICNAKISIVTNVGLEHTEILGNSLESIAREKAGIIKKNGTFITGERKSKIIDIFKEICKEKNSKFILSSSVEILEIERDFHKRIQKFKVLTEKDHYKVTLNLLGDFQIENACLAVLAAEELNIDRKSIEEGLKNVEWSGRFQIINENPLIILDCAKDCLAAKKLVESLNALKFNKCIIIFSCSFKSTVKSILETLRKLNGYFVFTEHSLKERVCKLDILKRIANNLGLRYTIAKNPEEALTKALALAKRNDLILVTGSCYLISDFLLMLKKQCLQEIRPNLKAITISF